MSPALAATFGAASATAESDRSTARDRRWERVIGLAIAGFVVLIYLVTNPNRHNFYEHFTWQAAAWLEGEAGIRYPVCQPSGAPTFQGTTCSWVADEDQPYNDFFLDVLPVYGADGQPTGRALIPFPPLPAVVLTPFVAFFGLNTDAQSLAALIGGLDVWLVWWLLAPLRLDIRLRAAATLFFGLGTVFWYTSMLGTTWYFAHVVAVGLALLAVGVALRADRAGVDEARVAVEAEAVDDRDAEARPDALAGPPGFGEGERGQTGRRGQPAGIVGSGSLAVSSVVSELRAAVRQRPWTLIDPRQFLAGFLLGLACTARLTIVFGLPFLAFVGGGGTPLRRTVSAGLGAALPILALVLYNVGTTGHVFHPAYEYLYQQEAYGYPELGYHPSWSIEDLRYVPQNLGLLIAGAPDVMPACPPGDVRSLFSETCPIVVPRTVGMSLLLSSPAYLLAIPVLLRIRRSRLIAGATIAVAAIAFANLMHFSQGWVQFGYRFSNDFVPFALVLIALGMFRLGQVGGWVAALVAASVVVNAWGVAWGVILQW
jgi:hypothetical protein